MKNLIYLLFVLSIIGCNSQENKEKETQQSNKQEQDTIKPKETWDVKKQYDEFGNLIKYDSIYSYSYSNIKGDSLQVNLDSIMDSFKNYVNKNASFNWKDSFSFFPENDSLFMDDFFKEDYFFKTWQNQNTELDKMIKKLDSSRNDFIRQFYPGLYESKDKS
ncbi:hypothetical protein [Winogradskyella thalassocola]|uniref:Uncharacterized protein n=1 Tax=Winogradskyella thalassocola TaxID=262004 RepID=A0A1G8JDN5_9FLAO|nr:hypothetical protein [Winogradskyella thalassocola]SDI29394.1 hypothetical protein SAMN04489796_10957 [Winogradskyella thalassocola]